MTELVPALWGPNGREYARETLAVKAQYEAATWSPARSAITQTDRGAVSALNRYTRGQLRDLSMWLWQNSPFVRGLIERCVTYTIGLGISPVSASADKVFSASADATFREWAWYPLVDSKATFSAFQRSKFRMRLLEGEHFTIKTFGPSGRPRLQAHESRRVRSTQQSGPTHEDGVTYDAIGRPVSYSFATSDEFGQAATFAPIGAESVIHSYTVARPGQRRGEPILASAINMARDVDDILALEKAAVKEASGKTDVIENESGEASAADIRAARFSGTPSIAVGASNPREAIEYYRPVFGAAPVYVRKGEKYTQYTSDRPGPAWQGFMDFLSQTICLSTGLPPSVLLQIKVGGADTRRDLACAARVFEVWQQEEISDLQEIWEYVIGSEIDRGFIRNPPSDWKSVKWHTPKTITVDSGREAQQDREDVAVGLMSEEEYFSRYGQDPAQERRTMAQEARARRDEIQAAGLTVEEYIQLRSMQPAAKSVEPKAAPAQEVTNAV